jgi:hypothetical protein
VYLRREHQLPDVLHLLENFQRLLRYWVGSSKASGSSPGWDGWPWPRRKLHRRHEQHRLHRRETFHHHSRRSRLRTNTVTTLRK